MSDQQQNYPSDISAGVRSARLKLVVATVPFLVALTILIWFIGSKVIVGDQVVEDVAGTLQREEQPVDQLTVEEFLSLSNTALDVSPEGRLIINGELKANGAFILDEGEEPQAPQTGQVFYDESTDEIRYYDGDRFLTILADENGSDNICFIGATNCGFLTAADLPATQSIPLPVDVNDLTNNGVLLGQGTGTIIATGAPGAGQVLIGNAGGVPTFTTFSGAVSVSGSGVVGINSGVVGAAQLSSTTVTSGTYGSATEVPVFDVDADGRVTGVTNVSIAAGGIGDIINGGQSGAAVVVGTNDANPVSLESNGISRLTFSSTGVLTVPGLNCTGNANGGALTADGSGVITCSDDEGGGASGITSLNGLTAATQTFTNDTNVTISSAGSAHSIVWSGQLSVARGGTGASTASGARANLGAAASGANSDITSLTGLTTALSVGQGGTGSTTAGGARTNLGAAASGANSDITSITGLTTDLSVDQGGTGAGTFTANGIIYGNGTGALQATAAGTTGQCLIGNTGSAPTWGSCPGDGVGIANLNGETGGTQSFAVGTAGSDFNISSGSNTHTFNIPSASATARGLVTTAAQTFAGIKTFSGNIIANANLTVNGNTTLGDTAGDTLTINGTSITFADFDCSTNGNGGALTANASGVISCSDDDGGDGVGLSNLNGQTGGTQSFANDTNVTISSAANTHSLGWTGTLAVGRGGTGASTFATNGVLYGNGAGALQTVTGTSGQVLIANGTGVPTFTTLGGDLNVNGSGSATITADAVALGGDTTGNYLAALTGGNGIGVTGSGSEGATPTVALGALTTTWNQTGAFDIILDNAASELQIRGSGGAFYAQLDAGALTVDETFTFAAGSGGNICTSAGNCAGVGGTGDILNNGQNGPITIGTNDATTLTLETGNTPRITIDGTGQLTLNGFDCSGNGNGGALTANASGVISCSDDDGGDGVGISSLNGLSGATQTFANGTNVTITSVGTTHSLGWTGQLAIADGGTGASTAAGARSNLGLGGLAVLGAVGTSEITNDTILAVDLDNTVAPGVSEDNYVLTYDHTSGGFTWVDPSTVGTPQDLFETFNTPAGTDPVADGATDTLNFANGAGISISGDASTDTITITNDLGADIQDGEVDDDLTISGSGSVADGALSANVSLLGSAIDLASEITGTLAVANGGTGATTAAGARSNLGAAASGANSDITSLSGLTTALSIAQGGTGGTTAQAAIDNISGLTTQGDLLYHNGTNSTRLARGTVNQCLLSTATTIQWGSCTAGGGGFTSLTLAGDSGPNQTISDTDTLTFAGGTNINTVASATDTVTINLESSPTLSGSLTVQTNTTLGDANTDTLTINAGSDGSGITFGDVSFQSCVLETNATGVLTCGTDGGDGVGIADLNGETGGTQSFANDTNVTITSAANTHTLGWTGTLAIARGGTGASTAAGARTNLGLGGLAVLSAVGSSEITDNSVQAVDLEVTAAAGLTEDNYILTYDHTSGGFTWVDPSTVGIDSFATVEVDGVAQSTGAPTLDFDDSDFDLTEAPADSFDITLDASVTQLGSSIQDGEVDDDLTISGSGSVADGALSANVSLLGSAIDLASEITGTLGIANGGTGATTAAGARGNLGAAASGANGDITSLTALTAITPGAALTVGATGQGLTLQGSAATTITATDTGFTTTVGFITPTANVAINFPALSAGTYQVCTTSGNCLGGGGGGANTALSNLASVALNTSLLPGATNIIDLGSDATAFRDLYLVNSAVFEGSIADANETTITVENPTVDVTYRFANPGGGTGTYDVCTTDGNCVGGAGGGAPNAGAYLTVGNNGTLTSERAITAGTNLSAVDGGANGSYTLNVDNNPTFSGLVTANGGLTVEAGDTFTFNSDAFTDLTGTGLEINLGSLQVDSTVTQLGSSIQDGEVDDDLTISGSGSVADGALSANVSLLGAAIDLASEVTGTLPSTAGGTGLTSFTTGDLIYSSSGNTLSQLNIGTANQCLIVSGGVPTWGSCTAGGGGFTNLTLAGDTGANQTITDTNTITIAGGANIATVGGATDTVTINFDGTLPIGSGGTGATGAAGARSNLGAAASGANADITSLTALTSIAPSAPLTVGATGQALTLQGTAATTLTATDTGFTTTVGFVTPTANATINFPTLSSGTYTVCTSSGNCLGGGGGGANTALSNLTGVAINTSLLPASTNTIDLGSDATAFRDAYLGNTIIFEGSSADAFETTISVEDPTVDVTYRFANPSGAGSYDICTSDGNCLGGAGGGAPSAGAFLTIGNDATLTAERAIAAGTNLNAVDGGANGSYTLNVDNNPTFSGLVTANGGLTIEAGDTFTFNGDAFTDLTGTGLEINLGSLQVDSTVTQLGSSIQDGEVDDDLTISGSGSVADGALSANVSLLGASIDLASEITGTLAIANGGTGSTTAGGARTNLGAAASGANGDITSLTALTAITPGAALTVGATGQSLTLQGSAATTITATDSGFTTTVDFDTPTANVSISFPALAAGSYNVCTTSGNCIGGGAGQTLQGAYDAGNTILTTDARDIDFTLANTTTDPNFDIVVASGSTGAFRIYNDTTLAVSYDTTNGFSVPGSGGSSEQFGYGSDASGASALAVGYNASADENFSVAVGTGTSVAGQSSTVVGSGASTTSQSGTALGAFATAGQDSTAVGVSASTSTAPFSIALGRSATADGSGSIAIGNGADTASFEESIALGIQATNTAAHQLVVGSDDTSAAYITEAYLGAGVTSANAATRDFLLTTTGGSGTDIAGADFTLAAGRGTGAGAGGSLLFQTALQGGTGATLNALTTQLEIDENGLATFTGDILVNGGEISVPGGVESEQFGAGASASGTWSLAVGEGASANANSAVAVGRDASVAFQQGTAIGGSASTTQQNSVAVGYNSLAHNASIAVGDNVSANSSNSVALGSSAVADLNSSIALGYAATVTAANQLVIGSSVAGITQGYIGNGVTGSTPSAFTLNATGGSGTDIAGANFTLAAGRGTGTGAGGSLLFQTAAAGLTGTTLNPLTTRLEIAENGNIILPGLTNCDTIDTDGSGVLSCGSDAGAGGSSLQAAYDGGNSILTTDARDIDITLANTTTDPNFDIVVASGSTGAFRIYNDATLAVSYDTTNGFSVPGGGIGAEQFGSGASASAAGSLAVGFGASANSASSTALGNGAAASSGQQSVAIGNGATSSQQDQVVIGYGAQGGSGFESGTVTVGANATSTNRNSIALGASTTSSGDNSIALGYLATSAGTNSIAIGRSATTTASNQLVIGATDNAISDAYIGEGITDATPTSIVLNATGGSGTDIGGADFTLAAGRGTGTGAGGSLIFQTAPAGAAGASLNALVTQLTIDQNGLATFNGDIRLPDTDNSNYITLAVEGNETVDYTLYIPSEISANDEICLLNAANCAASGNTLQQAYTADADGGDAVIVLTAADGGLFVRDNATPLGSPLFVVEADGGADYLSVSASAIALDRATTVTVTDTHALLVQDATSSDIFTVNTTDRKVITETDASFVLRGGTALPGSPDDGEIFWDSDDDSLYIYDNTNSEWNQLNGNSSATYVVAASDSARPELADYQADGTADEVKIESAITAANDAGGGTVFLLEGTYNITTTIDLLDNVSLIGSGRGATTLIIPSATNSVFNIISVAGDDNVTIANLTVDGNEAGQTTDNLYGITVSASSVDTLIENVEVQNNGDTGIYVLTSGVTIRNSYVHSNLNDGIYAGGANTLIEGSRITSNGNGVLGDTAVTLAGSSSRLIGNYLGANNAGTANGVVNTGAGSFYVIQDNVIENTVNGPDILVDGDNVSVVNNIITNNDEDAIETTSSATDGVVSGNTIYNAVSNAIFIESSGTTISNNSIDITGADGIHLDGNSNVVTGNAILNVGSNGIEVEDAQRATVNDNNIFGPGAAGILVDGSSNGTISGNVVRSATTNGIQLDVDSHYNIVSGNQFHDNGSTGALDALSVSGDYTQVTGNFFTDNAGTSDYIGIGAAATDTYLADNTFDAAGMYTLEINDGGTGTIYSSQLTALSVLRSDASEFTSGRTINLTGTVDVTAASATVAANGGTGTAFDTELVVGDRITANGETHTVVAIASATSLTTATNWSATATNQAATKQSAALRVKDTSGNVDFAIAENGDIFFNNLDCTGNTNGGALTADANGRITCSDDDGGAGGGNTLQGAYNAGSAGDQVIQLSASNDSLIFRNPVGGTDSAFVLQVENLDTNNTTDGFASLDVNAGGSFDTTAGDLTNYGLRVDATATESAGGNTLNNVGLSVNVSGADNNYAALFNGGNVGIGTSAPTQSLEVAGDVLVEGAGGWDGAGDTASLYIGDTSNYIRGTHGSPYEFAVTGWDLDISTTGARVTVDAASYIDLLTETVVYGDLRAITDGSTTASPRLLGTHDSFWSSGEATRLVLGDNANGLQTQFAGATQLYAYGSLQLTGNRSSATAVAFSSDTSKSVEIINGGTDDNLVLTAGSGQTGANLRVRTNGGDDIFTILANGNFEFEGSTADGFETTLQVIDPTADVTYQLAAESAGTYEICTTANNCLGGGAGQTLQGAYDAGNTILTTDGRDIDITLANTTTDPNFDIVVASGSAGAFRIYNDTTLAVSYDTTNGFSVPGGGSLSEQFGSGASAAGSNALAVGNGASAPNNFGTAIGQAASATTSGTALGYQATGTASSGTAIGAIASAAQSATSLGYDADATALYSLAVGADTTASASATTAVGRFATNAYSGSIALGAAATTTAANQLVIGSDDFHSAYISEAYLGAGVTSANAATRDFLLTTTGGSGTDIGGADFTLAAGRGTGTGVGGSLLFQTAAGGLTGTTLNPLTTQLAINPAGLATFTGDILVNGGEISVPGSGIDGEQFGAGASATGNYALAVGQGATANADSSVAIGRGASTASGQSIALGRGANTTAGDAIAIGYLASAAQNAITIGEQSSATALNAITVGDGATNAFTSIVIGKNSTSTAANQLIVGGSGGGEISQGYFGNGVTASSPQAFTLNATGGSGTDIGGADFTLAAGRGTGTGAGGAILLQTAAAGGATGSSLNSLVTRLEVQADGDIAADTDTLFVDATNDRVGIGDATPQVQLEVNGGGADSATGLETGTLAVLQSTGIGDSAYLSIISDASSANAGIIFGDDVDATTAYLRYDNANDLLEFGQSGGFPNLVVDAAGDVAIGSAATNPDTTAQLSVSADNTTWTGTNADLVARFGQSNTAGSNAGINIQAGNTGNSFISFGDTDAEQPGLIDYDHNTNQLAVSTDSTVQLTVSSAGLATFTGDILVNGGEISVPGGAATSEQFGASASASGSSALAVGNTAIANADDSIALGHLSGTSNLGVNSVAIGSGASPSVAANNLVLIGRQATTDGNFSVAIGSSAIGGGHSVSIGHSTNSQATGAIAIGSTANATFANSIALGYSAQTTAVRQFVLGSEISRISEAYLGAGVTSTAAPSHGITLNATGGSGTDIGGADLTLAAGRGTGTGAGGSLLFQTALQGGTGATLNALTTQLEIDENGLATFTGDANINGGDLTVGTTSQVGTLTLNDGLGNTGSIHYDSGGVGSGYLSFYGGGTNGYIAEFRDCCNATFQVGGTDQASLFHYGLDITVGQSNAWGTNGVALEVDATANDNSSATGTVATIVGSSFAQPTFTADNTVTYTDAANVYIQGAPIAGGDETLTNSYALWVDGGTTRLDGNLFAGGAAVPTGGFDVDTVAVFNRTTANDAGIAIISNASDNAYIHFGDQTNEDQGSIVYNGTDQRFRFYTNDTSAGDHAFEINSNSTGIFGGNPFVSGGATANLDLVVAGGNATNLPASLDSNTKVLFSANNSTADEFYQSFLVGTSGQAGINFGDSDDENAGYITYNNSTNALQFGTNAASALTIDSAQLATLNGGLDIAVAQSAAWGTNGVALEVDATANDASSATGTVATIVGSSFAQPTFTANNTVTYTDAATLYVENAPIAGGDETLTNAYSLWVDAGASRFDGNLIANGGIDVESGDAITLDAGGTGDAQILYNGTDLVLQNPGASDGIFLNSEQLIVRSSNALYNDNHLIIGTDGVTTFRPSVNSAVGFSVLDTDGNNVLSVDTDSDVVRLYQGALDLGNSTLATSSSIRFWDAQTVSGAFATIDVPADITTSYALTLPAQLGSANDCLKQNNVSGDLIFGSCVTGGLFTDGGATTYLTATGDNFALGHSSADAKLHVETNVGTAASNAEIRLTNAQSDGSSQIVFEESNQGRNFVLQYDGTNNELEFLSEAGSTTNLLVIERDGSGIGIGRDNPGAKLDIDDSTSTSNVDILRVISDVGGADTVQLRVDSDGDILTLGDLDVEDANGVIFGTDDDATLAYDEAGEDRVELTGSGASLFIEDRLAFGVQVINVVDNGLGTVAAPVTITPTASYIELECEDVDGCTATMSEASADRGDFLIITNQCRPTTFSDTSLVSELAGGFTAHQFDSLTLLYSNSQWIELSRSDNTATNSGCTI